MFDVVLLIAGKGSRSSLEYNKVLYKVDGKPIFKYSLEVFLNCKMCRHVILVINPKEIEEVKKSVNDLDLSKIDYAFGGELRQDSVRNGIEKCSSEIVLIHDGARPLIKEEYIIDVYEAALKASSAVLAVKTIDTIKEYKGGIFATLNRKDLWNIQTPQGIRLDIFKIALDKAKNENYIATDDVNLLEKYFGISPKLVLGSYKNIKLTTKEDLEYIEFLLKRENSGL